MPLPLQHQTPAEFAARFWAEVQAARASKNSLAFCRLLWWLHKKLTSGDITDAQARASFNLSYGRSITALQWTTLRTTRILPAHDRWQAILDESDL